MCPGGGQGLLLKRNVFELEQVKRSSKFSEGTGMNESKRILSTDRLALRIVLHAVRRAHSNHEL